MKVFVTGATGFIGSAVVRELMAAGHQVLGLARSESAAESLAAVGAAVQRGDLEDPDSLRRGAEQADGVIHTAFIHDFSNYARSAVVEKSALETMGAVLAGSDRPLVVAAGVAGLNPGHLLVEDMTNPASLGRPSEEMALALAASHVRSSVMRLPPTVHGEGDHGFMAALIAIARAKGVSGYPGDGSSRWAAVHRLDAAHLFRLALENAPAGTRLHAIADEGVPSREIATVIGRHLNVPVVAVPAEQINEHFGWLGAFFAMDILASSAITQARFDWQPVQPDLLADLDQGHYFHPVQVR